MLETQGQEFTELRNLLNEELYNVVTKSKLNTRASMQTCDTDETRICNFDGKIQR
jgi:hypothetical protein